MNRFSFPAVLFLAILAPTAFSQSLTGIRIDGPGEVVENTVTTFRVFAEFDDGGEYEVTLFTELSVTPGEHATIDQFGRFDAQDVPGDQTETIHARFEFQQQEAIDELEVRIIDVAPAGHALRFDGNDDFVRVVRDASLEPEELTIEMWAKLDGPQTRDTRLLRKLPDGGSNLGYIFAADQGGTRRMRISVHVPESTTASDVVDHSVYADQWHHFAGTYSTTEARFYVDGQLVATTPHSRGPARNDPVTDLFIASGRPNPRSTEHFKGELDEVRIWDYARSGAEIRCLMNRMLRGDEDGLVGYWRFDDARGQIARDSSPFGNDGTLGTDDNAEGDAGDPTWILSEADITQPPFDPPLWTPLELVPEISSGEDRTIAISSDLLTMYIGTERGGFAQGDIYKAERDSPDDPFGDVVLVEEVSIPGFENHDNIETVAFNHLRLYISRKRGRGQSDLYVSQRAETDQPWGAPEAIESLNGGASEFGFSLSADELVTVFVSDRSGPWRYYAASREAVEDEWGAAVLIDTLNALGIGNTDMSPDGLTLYAVTQGPDGIGGWDVWRSTRLDRDSQFGEPILVPGLSTTRDEWDITLSPDGRTAFIHRDDGQSRTGRIYITLLEGGAECTAACCVDGTCSMRLEEDCPAAGCARLPEWQCDGDVDGDGQVNPVDVGQVQSNFGNTTEQAMCNYDVDCDGQINPVDSGIVQSLMGTCDPPRDSCGTGTFFPDDNCESVECP